MQLSQDLPFVHHALHTALGEYARLAHLLHRVQLLVLGFLALNFPDLAEAAFSDAKMLFEVGFADSCIKLIFELIRGKSNC